ncbi:phosphotransferase [Streptomyces sp. NPDC007083]|uniref:phosphotransferase n=1 Tax=unclassified Streptomyces TaxID=2593676 RepID=UPI00340918C4
MNMSGAQRHTEPVDVHLILRRDTGNGPEVLLSRRAGAVYAAGLWHLPSGNLDGPHEDVVTALIRAAREETGVEIDPTDVRAAVTVHHHSTDGRARTGFPLEVRRWKGDPRIAEPDVCNAMDWVPLDALPADMVAYCRAGLDAYRSGAWLAVHFLPNDTIVYDPGADRLRLVAAADAPPPAKRPGARVVEFAEQTVGPIATWIDVSWMREGSRVWKARGAQGGNWYVKIHQSAKFHTREVVAYRTWVPTLGTRAPRLMAADEELRAVVLTALPGRPLHGASLPPQQERDTFRRIGALARRVHQASTPRPAPTNSGPAIEKAERHLEAARPHLSPGDEEFVRELTHQAADLAPLPWVETHGDFQLRNILRLDDEADSAGDADGSLALIDFERSEPGPAVRDLVRLSDAWSDRPDLYEALLDGYGRALTDTEQERLVTDTALDAVSGIAFGATQGDPEVVERGRRTLVRLRSTPRCADGRLRHRTLEL